MIQYEDNRMEIEEYILITYPTVLPYDSVRSVEDRLRGKGYLVVVDEKNEFCGILTPCDIVVRPHKLVIDCLTPKEIIYTDDSFITMLGKFEQTPSEALPVFRHGACLGVLEKSTVIRKLKSGIEDFRKASKNTGKDKTEFLHNLSHELRTPLNQILGFMSVIAELSPEEIEPNREQYYAIIKESSERFLSTMDDLIELSRLHSED